MTECIYDKEIEKAPCNGQREVLNKDGSCRKCMPYTRAQKGNSICDSDKCGKNQIVSYSGTCAECGENQ